MHAKRDEFLDLVALIFAILGLLGLASSHVPEPIAWFFVLAGFAMHYIIGLRTGVLGSGFFVFNLPVTVTRDGSPGTFFVAMVIEGMVLVAIFLLFLFSL